MDRIKRLIVRREFKIGIIGIVSLMIIIFGINYLKGVNMLRPTNYFFVRFDNIMRLAKSSTVYADGFRIGIVHNITYDYDHPGNVLVEVHLGELVHRLPCDDQLIIAVAEEITFLDNSDRQKIGGRYENIYRYSTRGSARV